MPFRPILLVAALLALAACAGGAPGPDARALALKAAAEAPPLKPGQVRLVLARDSEGGLSFYAPYVRIDGNYLDGPRTGAAVVHDIAHRPVLALQMGMPQTRESPHRLDLEAGATYLLEVTGTMGGEAAGDTARAVGLLGMLRAAVPGAASAVFGAAAVKPGPAWDLKPIEVRKGGAP